MQENPKTFEEQRFIAGLRFYFGDLRVTTSIRFPSVLHSGSTHHLPGSCCPFTGTETGRKLISHKPLSKQLTTLCKPIPSDRLLWHAPARASMLASASDVPSKHFCGPAVSSQRRSVKRLIHEQRSSFMILEKGASGRPQRGFVFTPRSLGAHREVLAKRLNGWMALADLLIAVYSQEVRRGVSPPTHPL